jgi:hypothetical protein
MHIYANIPSEQGGMSLAEKMALWSSARNTERLNESEEIAQQTNEIDLPPRYQQVRSFLVEGLAYKWLLGKAQSSALLTKGTVMEGITKQMITEIEGLRKVNRRRVDERSSTEALESRPSSQALQVNIGMDWDLPGFLRDQQYGHTSEVSLERAITLTGSNSDAQASCCIDYMCQTWPLTGREVVRLLQKALTSPNLSCKSKYSRGYFTNSVWNMYTKALSVIHLS